MSKGKSVKDLVKAGFKSRFHTDSFSMFEDIPPHLKGPGSILAKPDQSEVNSPDSPPNPLTSSINTQHLQEGSNPPLDNEIVKTVAVENINQKAIEESATFGNRTTTFQTTENQSTVLRTTGSAPITHFENPEKTQSIVFQTTENQSTVFRTTRLTSSDVDSDLYPEELTQDQSTTFQTTENQSTVFRATDSNIFNTFNNLKPSKEIISEQDKCADFRTTENRSTDFQATDSNSNLFFKKSKQDQSTDFQTTEKQTTDFRTTDSEVEFRTNDESKKTNLADTQKPKIIPYKKKGISYNGYFPLKCSVFSPEMFLILKPGEYKIFSYLSFLRWRYPEAPGYVRAALPYLEKGTGIGRTAIHDHLKRLAELNLIHCQEVDKKNGNLYFISDDFIWSAGTNSTDESRTTGNQTTEKQATVVRKTDDSGPFSEPQSSGKRTKDLTPQTNLTSLSQHKEFNDRWMSLPKRLREREREVINFWIKKNPEDLEELYLSLVELETTKKDIRGNVCGSPIGLIESSWPDIKAHRERVALDAKNKAEAENSQASEAERKARAEEAQTIRYKQACDRFDNLTDEEYDQYLVRVHQSPDYSDVKPLKGSKAASSAIRLQLLEEDFITQ